MGAGPAANTRFVHVELCETSDSSKFKRSYERYVKLIGEILRERNIHPSKGLWTHKDVTYKLGGTDHEDLLIIFVVMVYLRLNFERMC